MTDVSPKLLKQIKTSFEKKYKKSHTVTNMQETIDSGNATYNEVNEFAIEVGELLAKAFQENLSEAVLPDGRMYFNIAKAVVEPMMKNNYDIVSKVAAEVQNILNASSKIGIKAIEPALNQDRIDGIINRISNEEHFDEVKWILSEPVVNFTQSIVDDSIKANAEFQYAAGLTPKIIRTVAGNCCEWCRALAGKYSYPDVPKDVYRRHQRCRCTVNYHPGDGKVQNVHTKEWKTKEERDIIQKRKMIGKKSLPLYLAEHPKRLASFTPSSLKDELERNGFDVKPLKRGSLKDIPFEEGGGYKVNFEDGGILQYHPEGGSHHTGEYYKISTGKGGRHRYDTDGNEKKD